MEFVKSVIMTVIVIIAVLWLLALFAYNDTKESSVPLGCLTIILAAVAGLYGILEIWS